MAISNFYLPTGLTVSGSTSLTGSLHATKNVIAQSFTGSFSGSDANITNISASVISTDALRLPDPFLLEASLIRTNELVVLDQIQTPFITANTISASNLILPDNFIFIADTIGATDLIVTEDTKLNLVQANELQIFDNLYLPDPYIVLASAIQTADLQVLDTASINSLETNVVSASNLYLENPFLMIADTIQTTDLEVLGVLNVSGNLNVYTDSEYNIVNSAVEDSFIDVPLAISLLDANASNTASQKIKITGSLDSSGFTKINLTAINSNFNTSSLDYVTLNTSVKENGRWIYHAFSVELFNSGSSLCVEITAAPNNVYKLIAINEI